jgi:hypothetical protein
MEWQVSGPNSFSVVMVLFFRYLNGQCCVNALFNFVQLHIIDLHFMFRIMIDLREIGHDMDWIHLA